MNSVKISQLKKMRSSCAVILTFILVFTAVLPCGNAYAAQVGNSYISSAGACVMDCDTGEVLYELNGYALRVPASMTKIMTLYCVYEALENGEITLDTRVPISSNVYWKSRNQLYQNMISLNYDTVYTVDEIMGVVITYSASAATVALAELVGGGSEQAFVSRMNKTAKKLGINAHYYDSCGVADNQITPVSMADLARKTITKYPDIIARSSKKSVTFKGAAYKTTNHLLDTYYYEGADGLKTGTSTAAGACFCGTALRDGKRLISVTMGSSSAGQRFTDTARLLNYGFGIIKDRRNIVCFTNIRTFMNGLEMPTFSYVGTNPHAVVVAEDLANYGFDVTYDDALRKISIKENAQKAKNPIALDIYKNRNGQKAFSVKDSNITVALETSGGECILSDVYNVGGYTCISIDELANYFNFEWNGAEMTAYIGIGSSL